MKKLFAAITTVTVAFAMSIPVAEAATKFRLTVAQKAASRAWYNNYGKGYVQTMNNDYNAIDGDLQNANDPNYTQLAADCQAMVTDMQVMLSGARIPYGPVEADWAAYLRYTIAAQNDEANWANDSANGNISESFSASAASSAEMKRTIPLGSALNSFGRALGQKWDM